MKNLFMAFTAVALLASCSGNKTEEQNTDENKDTTAVSVEKFGKEIDENGAIQFAELVEKMKTSATIENIKVSAPITKVCQEKGCWMKLDGGNGQEMRVTFKDYGFFVPKDCAGKIAFVEGRATMDTTTVESLREYAKDDGKSKEEIEKITEPEYEMVFEAEGVIIK